MPSDRPGRQQPLPETASHVRILAIVLIYAICAGAWIADKPVAALAGDPDTLVLARILADGLYIAVTSLLLYGLLRRLAREGQPSPEERVTSQRLLTAIADSSDDAIFALDLEGRLAFCNRAASRILGKRVEDMVGRDARALFPDEQAEAMNAVNRRVIAENCGDTREEAIDTANGRRVLLTSKGPLRDTDGRVIGIFGIARDITLRKQAEAALRENEQRFRTLFDNAAVAILVQDRDSGAIIDANRRAIESYGYATLEELQQSDIWLEPPYAFADAVAHIRKAAREGPQRFEWKSRDRHGRIFWEDVLLNTITLDGVERVLSIASDITVRKAAEAAVSRQAEELAQRNAELERFNRAMVGRELEMIALKRQVNALSAQLGREPPYSLAFLDDPAAQGEEHEAP